MNVGEEQEDEGVELSEDDIIAEALAERCRPKQVEARLAAAGITMTRGRLRWLLKKHSYTGYTDISDAALVEEVCDILQHHHGQIGGTLTAGALRSRGVVVPRRRMRDALRMARASTAQAPASTRRVTFFNGVAPDFLWCIDSNCKLVDYRIYIHAAIDGFSRLCKFHWLTVRVDSGTVVKGFVDHLRALRHLPHHLRFDRHGCWRGIGKLAIELLGERDPHFVPVGGGEVVRVDTVQYGKSIHNTPVEIQWRFLNQVTAKWYNEFKQLRLDGILACDDDPRFGVDLWCLHEIYLEPLSENINEHYGAANYRPRRFSSRSPFHVSGAPRDVHRSHESVALWVREDEIEEALEVLADDDSFIPEPAEDYELSPLLGTDHLEAFKDITEIIQNSDQLSLREKYIELRDAAHRLLDIYEETLETDDSL